jgi:hypothetical protein
MVDEPAPEPHDEQSSDDLEKLRAAPEKPEAAPPTGKQEVPEQKRNYSQYGMRPLKAIGRGTIAVVRWTDRNSGFITVLATVAIAVLTFFYVRYSRAQWTVMSDTLRQAEQSSQQSTNQVWQAIGNINWMARSMDWSQKGTQAAIEHSDRLAKRALDASVAQAKLDRRPWVGLQLLQCNNCRTDTDGSLIIGDLSAVLVNTGKTPAVDMVVESILKTAKASDSVPTYDAIEQERESRLKKALTVPSNLPPNMAASIAKAMVLVERDITPPREVSAPNAPRGITIIGGLRQGRDSRAAMEDRVVVYGLGKVTYYDGSRTTQYTTTFCVMNDAGASFRYCPTGNEMN